MIRLLKSIECLYVGIVVAGATTVIFDGSESIKGHEYIKFDVLSYSHINMITKVSMNKDKLYEYLDKANKQIEEITLIIPAEVHNKRTCIGEKTFAHLDTGLIYKIQYLYSKHFRLKIQFKSENGKRVKFPENCSYMFDGSDSITEIDLSGVSSRPTVINTGCMFKGCYNLEGINFGNFNTSNVTNMSWMFFDCQNLKSLDLSNFDTHNVTTMNYMFWNCQNLLRLNTNTFDTRRVTSMVGMFGNCQSLTSLSLSNFNTSNVKDMWSMFHNCHSLTHLDLSRFNTQNVTDIRYMFDGCKSLNTVNLSSEYYSMDFVDTLMKYCDFLTINFL